jgi:hypothetical protein
VIAKQVRAPSAAKHKFAGLVKYLVDGQDKLQRVARALRFSQSKMEARLGEFVVRTEVREERAPRKAYAKKPVLMR